jgi:haloacetate dehalogenase
MFEGFTEERIDVGAATLRVRHGGTGPAVLLLHGHPRTSATWNRVAPRLVAAGFTVVCPDLRGYGQSSKPPTTADHGPYSKRAMAADTLTLMRHLGHEKFSVAGHDRGSYVAFRLAMDHPEAVSRVALLDSVPIIEHLERCDDRFATGWWHWFFFAQPDKPERAINADPDAWYNATADAMGDEAYEDYRQAIHDPETVHAMLEDYRAGLGVDREHDEADRKAGRTITCPALVLWSTKDDLEQLHGDPLLIWRAWADDVRGHGIESGHHLAEEAPDELSSTLGDFFAAGCDAWA